MDFFVGPETALEMAAMAILNISWTAVKATHAINVACNFGGIKLFEM